MNTRLMYHQTDVPVSIVIFLRCAHLLATLVGLALVALYAGRACQRMSNPLCFPNRLQSLVVQRDDIHFAHLG